MDANAMTAEQAIEAAKGLTFEKVWAALQEMRTQIRESQQETDRQIRESRQETEKQIRESQQETDRQIRETSNEVRELSNCRIGKRVYNFA